MFDFADIIASAIDLYIASSANLCTFISSSTFNPSDTYFIIIIRILLVLCVTKDLVSKINAGNFIQDIGKEFGSGGGGPAHFGTTGFKNIDILNKSFKKASEKIKGIL